MAWSYAGATLVIVAQIAYTAFTARILEPSAFGAYASAQALIALMGYFSLATVGAALARKPALAVSTVGTALCDPGEQGLSRQRPVETGLVTQAVSGDAAHAPIFTAPSDDL